MRLFTDHQRRYVEIVVEGKPLGRHVRHDRRSNLYLVAEGTKPTSPVLWPRRVPVFDQGQVGSCTGNAQVGEIGTDPLYVPVMALPTPPVLAEPEALVIYSAAEVIDGDGPYPPNDNGSSGLSAAQAAKNAGLISGYVHATTLAAAYTAIQTGPFAIGSDWYTSFDTPDANGLIAIAPGATVRGGHEYECRGYDPATDLWHLVNSWGTSFGVAGEMFYDSSTLQTLLESSDGDITQSVPLSQPAPTPTPPSPSPIPANGPAPSPTEWARFLAELRAIEAELEHFIGSL